RIAFEIPAADQIPQRLEAVLNAIYAAYGSSWEDAAGRDQRAVGLADEAIWLARVLRDVAPNEPEGHGLLALLLHCAARRPARRVRRWRGQGPPPLARALDRRGRARARGGSGSGTPGAIPDRGGDSIGACRARPHRTHGLDRHRHVP